MSKELALQMVKQHNPAQINSNDKYKCRDCGKEFAEKDGFWCAFGDLDHVEFMCETDYYEMLDKWE